MVYTSIGETMQEQQDEHAPQQAKQKSDIERIVIADLHGVFWTITPDYDASHSNALWEEIMQKRYPSEFELYKQGLFRPFLERDYDEMKKGAESDFPFYKIPGAYEYIDEVLSEGVRIVTFSTGTVEASREIMFRMLDSGYAERGVDVRSALDYGTLKKDPMTWTNLISDLRREASDRKNDRDVRLIIEDSEANLMAGLQAAHDLGYAPVVGHMPRQEEVCWTKEKSTKDIWVCIGEMDPSFAHSIVTDRITALNSYDIR